MNASSTDNRAVSTWIRVRAGLLTALLIWAILGLGWAIMGGRPLPWPILEARAAPNNAPDSPFWRKGWSRRPPWVLRAGLVVLACAALGNAIMM